METEKNAFQQFFYWKGAYSASGFARSLFQLNVAEENDLSVIVQKTLV